MTSEGPIVLPTLTHARVRVAQGDPPGARRILEEILSRHPHDAEARSLLEEIRSARGRPRAEEPPEEALPPPTPGDPAALRAGRQRGERARDEGGAVVRLSDYLARIRRSREREGS